MDYKANYHTHTYRCHHAEGGEREYIEQAIAAGYGALGFSDHSPMIYDTNHVSSYRMSLDEAEGYFTSLSENLK